MKRFSKLWAKGFPARMDVNDNLRCFWHWKLGLKYRELLFTLHCSIIVLMFICRVPWNIRCLYLYFTHNYFVKHVSFLTGQQFFVASPKWWVIIQSIVHQIDGRKRWLEFGETVSQHLILLLQVPFSWSWWLSRFSQQAIIPPISFPSSIWGEVFMPVLSARALNYDS